MKSPKSFSLPLYYIGIRIRNLKWEPWKLLIYDNRNSLLFNIYILWYIIFFIKDNHILKKVSDKRGWHSFPLVLFCFSILRISLMLSFIKDGWFLTCICAFIWLQCFIWSMWRNPSLSYSCGWKRFVWSCLLTVALLSRGPNKTWHAVVPSRWVEMQNLKPS